MKAMVVHTPRFKKTFYLPFEGNRSKNKLKHMVDRIAGWMIAYGITTMDRKDVIDNICETVEKRLHVVSEFEVSQSDTHVTIRSKNGFYMAPLDKREDVVFNEYE